MPTNNWVVLKFGGTSVSGLAQWRVIADLVRERRARGMRVLVVCSAVAGVTNDLVALADEPGSEDKLLGVLDRHRQLAVDLGVAADSCIMQAERMLRACCAQLRGDNDCASRAELLATGEWLSTRIGEQFLQQTLQVTWVDAREALHARIEEELSTARQWLSASCLPGADPELASRWEKHGHVLITQGFIARGAKGGTALLGRGGSDTSAALFAGRLNASELEIWTDVPGVFSADPRMLPDARLLMGLDYEEALELAASGAGVVHPRCIRTAAATRTPIFIRDSGRPQLAGTRIGASGTDLPSRRHDGVKAITCQKGMIVLLMQNIDTRREVGFLARVFDIFRRHGISIDLVATSETTTTAAINGPANQLDDTALASVVSELQTQCSVRVHTDCVCVNLVGNAVRTALAGLQSTLRFFQDHTLLMMSLSANDLCLSLLVENTGHEDLVRQAHDALIPAGGDAAGVFGESWTQITRSS